MQVKVLGTFTEGDRINAIASSDRLHQTTGIPGRSSPVRRLSIIESEGT